MSQTTWMLSCLINVNPIKACHLREDMQHYQLMAEKKNSPSSDLQMWELTLNFSTISQQRAGVG